MNRHLNFRKSSWAAILAALALSPAFCQATFHVITYTPAHPSPLGMIEGSPDLFYLATGSHPVVLSVTPQGTETVLASFPDNYQMAGAPVSGANGRFYDTEYVGVNPANVFSVSAAAGSRQIYAATTLVPYLRQNLPDGALLAVALPDSGGSWSVATVDTKGEVTPIYQLPAGDVLLNVIYASNGNYYGLAQNTTGYLFRLTPSGTLTKLANFPAGVFDQIGDSPLLQARDGNLYGATVYGGANGTGTIFKVTLSGQYTLLYTFPHDQNSFPATLIEGSDGSLYGATLGHIPTGGYSQLFRITTSGQYTLLFAMSNLSADGVCQCSLLQGSDGSIYGTASSGGPTNSGAVFYLDAGLPKPTPAALRARPQSGAPGTQVLIWGNNLLGASVEFNGVAATEVTNSGPNYVLATVPAGATTGPITVTTPGGTDATSITFTVE